MSETTTCSQKYLSILGAAGGHLTLTRPTANVDPKAVWHRIFQPDDSPSQNIPTTERLSQTTEEHKPNQRNRARATKSTAQWSKPNALHGVQFRRIDLVVVTTVTRSPENIHKEVTEGPTLESSGQTSRARGSRAAAIAAIGGLAAGRTAKAPKKKTASDIEHQVDKSNDYDIIIANDIIPTNTLNYATNNY